MHDHFSSVIERRGRLNLIKVIFGETGAGKTKRIIDIANETLKTANGSIVFIDNDSQYISVRDAAVSLLSLHDRRHTSGIFQILSRVPHGLFGLLQ